MSFFVIDRIKSRLHRDIVADPVLHGAILNLYLNGEAYPHRVDDYFPVGYVSEPELAAQMTRHAQEEDKHIALYRKAINRLGQEVVELPLSCIFNTVIRNHTEASFSIAANDDPDARTLKVAHFMAHAHCLEKRVARSLEYHVEACAHSASDYPTKAVGAVLADEYEHVRYTGEAVNALLPQRVANQVWAHHRRAEWRGNLDFSASQLRRVLVEHGQRWSGSRRGLYRASAWVLSGLLQVS